MNILNKNNQSSLCYFLNNIFFFYQLHELYLWKTFITVFTQIYLLSFIQTNP